MRPTSSCNHRQRGGAGFSPRAGVSVETSGFEATNSASVVAHALACSGELQLAVGPWPEAHGSTLTKLTNLHLSQASGGIGVAQALVRAASALADARPHQAVRPRQGTEMSLRTPDAVENAVSLSWGRSPTCPVPIQDFPTGQVGDLPHQGSTEIPTPATLPPHECVRHLNASG